MLKRANALKKKVARRLLEGRNITPIDFAPLVAGCAEEDRQRRAIESFLKYLE